MRMNIYSQELLLDEGFGLSIIEPVSQESNTGLTYSAVRLFLHSSPRLHHPPRDDDRSAITIWLPQSGEKRERLATILELMADLVRQAPPETGLD